MLPINDSSNFLHCVEVSQLDLSFLQATACASGKADPNAGYQYRRLMTNVLTGIYECNPRCSCRKTCLNRVAQRPLKLRLQVCSTFRR